MAITLKDRIIGRFAGIFDDVILYATPNVRLFDWYVVTDLDDTYTDADLLVQIDVKNIQILQPLHTP